jgi:hypothetical protein
MNDPFGRVTLTQTTPSEMLMRMGKARIASALALAIVLGGAALAACPPDCVPGGGPAATDCFVAWSGIPQMAASCVDGTTCDVDGEADGVCTIGIQGCINVAGLQECTPSGLTASPAVKPGKSPIAQALSSGLGRLDPGASACSEPGLALPVKSSIGGIKKSVTRLTVSAASGGRKDRDRLVLTCEPSATPPSFAQVQDVFTRRCATPTCHVGPAASQGLNLQDGRAYDALLNRPSTEKRNAVLVQPGSLKRSYLARKVLGKGIVLARMPVDVRPLDPADVYTLLSWIQNGAPGD